MTVEVVSMGCEVATSHFIDEEQAEHQIDMCEVKLRGDRAMGRPVKEAAALLEKAREFLGAGMYTKAFLCAVRARGIALERLAPSR
jgi:hypothetical protein